MKIKQFVASLALFAPTLLAEELTHQADGEDSVPQVVAKDQKTLEHEFQEKLTGATLIGSWQMTTDQAVAAGKLELSPPRQERYTIMKVTKFLGRWIIAARIQYGDKDVTIPVPVKVIWAEDTPIISVTDADLPGLGKYSARVMFYGDYYAGTWFGDCYGGVLSGRITKTSEESAEQAESKPDSERPTSSDTE